MFRTILAILTVCAASAASAAQPRFSDQTDVAGVAMVHDQSVDHRAGPMTGGGCVGDFDADGYPDLFVIGGGLRADALFINQRNGTFADRAEAWGIAERHRGTGCTVGDVDADGDDDLYVTSLGPSTLLLPAPGRHRLYRNDGGRFVDVAEAAGVNATASHPDGFGAAFGDIDLDGDLDLFVAGWHAVGAVGALGSKLFRNRGDGRFDDVTIPAGVITQSTHAFGAIFADMDGDRYPELLVPGDFGTSRYYGNNRDGTFTELDPGTGEPPVLATDPNWSIGKAHNGMGTAVADFDRDGRLDWFVTAIWPTFHFESPFWGNGLYMNRGEHRLLESAAVSGVADGGWGWGVAAADFNHDGRTDIVMTNGWRDTDGVTGESFAGEPAYLFAAAGGWRFRETGQASGLHHEQQGRGLVTLDYDRDGDLDIVIFSNLEPLRLYRNDVIGHGRELSRASHWLKIGLDTSARGDLAPGGLGAHIRVTAGRVVQHGWMTGGGTYLGRSEPVVHFGLGKARHVDELVVVWPDGSQTVREKLAADQHLTITPAPRRGREGVRPDLQR